MATMGVKGLIIMIKTINIIIIMESLGTVEEATSSFLTELGHRISALSGDSQEIVERLPFCYSAFLFLSSDLTPSCCSSFAADSRPEDDL